MTDLRGLPHHPTCELNRNHVGQCGISRQRPEPPAQPPDIDALKAKAQEWGKIFPLLGHDFTALFARIAELELMYKQVSAAASSAKLFTTEQQARIAELEAEHVEPDYQDMVNTLLRVANKVVALQLANKEQAKTIERLRAAIRYTQEYIGPDSLPSLPGWSWFDALMATGGVEATEAKP